MTESTGFVAIDNISIISKSVSEPINQQYLEAFLQTAIEGQGISFKSDSLVHHTFLPNSNHYEILIIEEKQPILPSIFSVLYAINNYDKNKTDLFICDDFFTLYQNGKFQFFKSTEPSLNINDIKNYIKQYYKIEVDNTFTINKKQIENIKRQYVQNINKVEQLKFDKLSNSKSGIYFICYLVLLLGIFYFNSSNNKPNTIVNNKQLQNAKLEYTKLLQQNEDNKKSIPQLVDFFYQVNNYHIKLLNLKVDKNKIFATLQHKDKIRLLDFLDLYKKRPLLKHISFNESLKKYDMVAQFELF